MYQQRTTKKCREPHPHIHGDEIEHQETIKQEDNQRDETEKPPKRSSQELQQITEIKIEDALIPCCKIERQE